MNPENQPASPGAMPVILNPLDDIPDANPEQSLLSISIKHEPLDLTDNDSNEESAEDISQNVAENCINKLAVQIHENLEVLNPPLDEPLLKPEFNSSDTLNHDNDIAFVAVNSSQNLSPESKKGSKVVSNVNDISNLLVNSNLESVLDDIEVTCFDQNSPRSDPFENPLEENSVLLEDNTYSCSLCSFTTDRRPRLSDHERNHRKTNLPIIQCFYCSQRYTRNLLHIHIQNVHPGQKFQIRDEKSHSETSYECSKCSFSTKFPQYLSLHMKKHLLKPSKRTENTLDLDTAKASSNELPEKSHSETSYDCSKCSFSTKLPQYLTLHMRKHLLKPSKRTKNSFDPDTSKASPNELAEKSHSETSYDCSKCSFSTRLPQYLTLHMKKHLSKPSKRTKNFLNPDTSKASPNELPEKSSEPETALNCSFCSFLASDKDVLRLHIKTHLECTKGTDPTGKTCWYCGACSYSTSNYSHMTVHEGNHLKNKPIKKCSRCDYHSTPKALFSHSKFCCKEAVTSRSKSVESKRLIKPPNNKMTFKTSLKYNTYSVSRTDKLKLKFHTGKNLQNKTYTLVQSNGHKIYKCQMCSYTHQNFESIVNHVHAHKYASVVKCSNCDFKSTPRVVKYHLLKCKKNLKLDSAGMGTIAAKIDPTILQDNKGTVKTHRKCSSCSFSTNDDFKLKIHMKKHLNEPEVILGSSGCKIYQCKMCSYSQKKLVAIMGHIATHKNVSIVNCPNCAFKSTPRAVKHHLRHCNKRLKQTDNTINIQNPDKVSKDNTISPKLLYKPDITTSSGYKVYQCKMCSYGSRDCIAIAVHINSHKKNLPIIKCPNCDFKSTRRTVMCHLRKCKESLKSLSDETASDDKIERNSVSSFKNPNTLFKCDTCTFSSTNDLELKVHKNEHFFEPEVSTDSCGGKIYQCRMCSYALKNEVTMIAHINSHKDFLYNVKCPNCDFQSTPSTVRQHSRRCKETLQFTRRIKENTSKVNNRQDLVEFSEPNKLPSTKHFRCLTCSFSTTNELKFKLHKKKHNKEPKIVIDSNGRVKFCCEKCSYVCDDSIRMIGHINTHKTNLSIVKCPYCDFKSTTRTVKFHLRKCERRIQPNGVKNISEVAKKSSETPIASCSTNKIKLKVHTETKNHFSEPVSSTDSIRRKRHQCKMCSYTTSKLKTMKSHINAHKRNHSIIKCSNCDYRSTARSLRFHMINVHLTTETSFSCEYCSFVTWETDHYIKHMKAHKPTGSLKECTDKYNEDLKDIIGQTKNKSIKRFKCKLCSFVSSQGAAYASHMTSHDQKHPIKKCPRCNYKSTPSSLLTHMNIKGHSGKIKCRVCSLVCRNQYNLNNHMRSHLLRMPIKKCPHCSFKSTVQVLRAHIQKCQNMANKDSSKIFKDGLFEHPNKNIIDDDCNDAEEDVSGKRDDKTIETGKILEPKTEKSLFKCSQCSFSTYLRIKLKFHKKKYHLEQRKTPENNKSLKETIKQSVGVKAKKKLYNCTDCSYVTKHSGNYSRHIRTHLYPKKRTYTVCKKCSYKSTRSDLKIHYQTCQGKKKPKLKCSSCLFSSDKKENLKDHIENRHFDKLNVQDTFETIECSMCDYVTLFRQKFNEHTKTQHDASDVLQSNQPKDDQITRTVKNTTNHESDDKTVYKCTSCAFSSIHQGNLKRHIDMNHVENPIRKKRSKVASMKRSDEESSFDRQSKIRSTSHSSGVNHKDFGIVSRVKHQNDIGDVKDLGKSNHSDKKFKKVSKTNQKNASETSESDESEAGVPDEEEDILMSAETYACVLCSYTTSEKAEMDNHRQLHLKNMPIKSCPNENCNYKSTPKALSLHFLKCSESIEPMTESEEEVPFNPKTEVPKNTGPKSFQCKYCSFTSLLEYVMERHMNSHTLNLPIEQCSRCDFRSTPTILAAHLKSCTKRSKNEVSDASTNQPPKKKLKQVANSREIESNDVQYNENTEKVNKNKLCGEIVEAYQVISSDDDHESSESESNDDSDSEWSEPQNNQEVMLLPNHNTPLHVVNNQKANHTVVQVSEITMSSSTTGNSPKNTFQCPKCSFSCKLRIVLKVHIDKNH